MNNSFRNLGTLLLGALASLLLSASAIGQTNEIRIGGVPYHPFRKVGDRYYDLRPAYIWLQESQKPGAKPGRRPMPEWVGCKLSMHDESTYRVWSVAAGGVVLAQENSDGLASNYIFLKNYPHKARVADREAIKFLALKVGVISHEGSTYPLYDYGAPYDPVALAQGQRPMVSIAMAPSGNSGYVTNISGRTLEGVSLRFGIYNYDNAKLRDATTSVGRLAPGEFGRFVIGVEVSDRARFAGADCAGMENINVALYGQRP